MDKKKKINSILWGVGYFLVTCCIVASACVLFHNNYYSLIYVEGSSMVPTLNKNTGDRREFGIVDEHKTVINSLKRFDIVTTYYPIKYHSAGNAGYISDYCYINDIGEEVYTNYDDPNHKVQVSKIADFKIKRVIALPGESFRVISNGVEVRTLTEDNTWGAITTYKFPFKHSGIGKEDDHFRQLGDDEFWVLGDNWSSSTDCKVLDAPIKKGNIQGKLIAIEGTCKVKMSGGKALISDKRYYASFRFF